MYFKENWRSVAEKEPPLGRISIFQTSPKNRRCLMKKFSFVLAVLMLVTVISPSAGAIEQLQYGAMQSRYAE